MKVISQCKWYIFKIQNYKWCFINAVILVELLFQLVQDSLVSIPSLGLADRHVESSQWCK